MMNLAAVVVTAVALTVQAVAGQNATAALCAAQAGDCSKCLGIVGCAFCSPTVKKTGTCVLASEKSQCASDLGIAVDRCGEWCPNKRARKV